MRIGKKKKAVNMLDVIEEQTGQLVCLRIAIEEQIKEPTLSTSNVNIEQTEHTSPP